MELEVIQKIANVLKVANVGKISYNDEKIVTRTKDNKSLPGFVTICTELSKESKEFPLPADATARCQILQWVDYTSLFVLPARGDKQTTTTLLKELNAVLSTKSYLAANHLTLADIAVFYGVESIIGNLSNADKEQFINISRWFNHLQQGKGFVKTPINFPTIYLVGWTKGTQHI